jgi:hypothetical protein
MSDPDSAMSKRLVKITCRDGTETVPAESDIYSNLIVISLPIWYCICCAYVV